MLNSGKKLYSNSRVVRKKISERKKKNCPPPQYEIQSVFVLTHLLEVIYLRRV